ncbi:FKBP-type peptidyl-prolyl cis-trans isomerase [Phycisphaeraceae bacterium AH-315-B13]|nr:FKBP-type peptidyl-prolyl cis-trans isomerase [Phycisphaeraceae bacterium AH-315-B13]
MKPRWITAPLIGLALVGGSAIGQDEAVEAQPEPKPQLVEAPEIEMTFSDEEIAKAANMLTGVWKTSTTVREFGTNGETDIVMSIGPATITGLSDALYVEVARADGVASPYRQSIMQLYRYKGELRLRTFDLRDPGAATALLGMCFTPEVFPAFLTAAEFFPTMDIDLAPDGDGFSGASPAAYPDHRGGAVQMTSSISFDGTTINVSDIGFGTDGEVAWSVGSDSPVEFVKAEDVVRVDRYDDGLIVTHFVDSDNDPVADGDFIIVDYVGKLADGTKFDASFDRGEPFRYQYPGSLIQGWLRAAEGMAVGDRIRIYIPSELGYGERSMQRIPAGSNLVFDVECVFIERTEAQEAEPDETPAQGE